MDPATGTSHRQSTMTASSSADSHRGKCKQLSHQGSIKEMWPDCDRARGGGQAGGGDGIKGGRQARTAGVNGDDLSLDQNRATSTWRKRDRCLKQKAVG